MGHRTSCLQRKVVINRRWFQHRFDCINIYFMQKVWIAVLSTSTKSLAFQCYKLYVCIKCTNRCSKSNDKLPYHYIALHYPQISSKLQIVIILHVFPTIPLNKAPQTLYSAHFFHKILLNNPSANCITGDIHKSYFHVFHIIPLNCEFITRERIGGNKIISTNS